MNPEGVLLVADARGHILDRLATVWAETWRDLPHTVVYSAESHAHTLRRAGERAGLLHWVDPLAFALAPRAASVPQVVMVHHLTEPEVAPMIKAVQHADALTTSSLRWQRRLQELTGRPVWVVPYTIDTRVFHPIADRQSLRERLGFDASSRVIGFNAKAKADAYGRKGIPLFREILRAVPERWQNAAVLLIGAGWESQAEEIRATGLQVVHVEPPNADATASLYPAMDVFLCTSNQEGGPCTILEAMACGVPIITTDVGHVPEVVEHGRTGFVANEPGVRDFIDAMTFLFAGGNEVQGIIAAARRFVEEHRDHRTGLTHVDIDAIYRSAIARFAARPMVDRPLRVFSRTVLSARHAARRVGRVIRTS